MAENARPRKKRRVSDNLPDEHQMSDGPGTAAVAGAGETAKAAADARRSLFVRSLPAETTSESLAAHFSESYPIKHAVAVTDKATKKCKGYGFVTFTDAEDARNAVQEFNGSLLEGKKIAVEIAESRHREEGENQPKKAPKLATKADDGQPQPKLIVRNLPWSISTPEQLSSLFRSYGKIKMAVLPKKGRALSGFGIVLIRGRKNAEKALAGVNGKEVDGRTIAVDWAVDKDTWKKVKDSQAEADLPDVTEDKDIASEKEDSNDPEHSDESNSDETADEDEDDDVTGNDIHEDEDDAYDENGESLTKDDGEDRNRATTLFIRNLPFTTEDEDLYNHFRQFGPLRYARVVLDPTTERSRGTGFVCFVEADDCLACLKGAPKLPKILPSRSAKVSGTTGPSVLQDEAVDESGNYTIEGRVLSITQAVSRSDATRLTAEGERMRSARDKDKRRLYLLSEGTIPSNSAMYKQLSPSEIAMREASAKQRKMLIQSNPSLHISLTRLSVRNIPRSIDSKALKALARDAVVGFATDVKSGARQSLSKEELSRGHEEMKRAEAERRAKGKGVVRQAKVVFETNEGSKVKEADGGRSRGYGFIEYYTHRSALMGLRWLNGHAVGKDQKQKKSKSPAQQEDLQDRKKRLVVEFAIENAQVVQRRQERETKSRAAGEGRTPRAPRDGHDRDGRKTLGKRKRSAGDVAIKPPAAEDEPKNSTKDDKLAKRNRIISKKRAMRRARKGAS